MENFDWSFWSAQPLFLIEVFILLIVLVAAPLYACFRHHGEKLRGLNLPAGSIRAMLALVIVGSFVNVLLFGGTLMGEQFEQVITAFGTLAGAVTGFYFAGRNAAEASNGIQSRQPTLQTTDEKERSSQ